MFDALKNFQNMRIGDPAMFAPKGEGGWQTAVQKEGSMRATTPQGAFAGINPKVSDVGRALQGAAAQMPNGPPAPSGGPQWNGRGFENADASILGRVLSTSAPPGWRGTMDEWRSGASPGQSAAAPGQARTTQAQQPNSPGAFAPGSWIPTPGSRGY